MKECHACKMVVQLDEEHRCAKAVEGIVEYISSTLCELLLPAGKTA